MLPAPLVALLLTSHLSSVVTTFSTPPAVPPGLTLQITPDGKFATDGETWIDLTAEKVVPATAVPDRDKLPIPPEPCGKLVEDPKDGKRVRVVHPTTKRVSHLKPEGEFPGIVAFAVSADGDSAAVVTLTGLHLFDTATEKCVRVLPLTRRYDIEWGPEVTFTPDGKEVLIGRADPRRVFVVPVDAKAEPRVIDVGDGNDLDRWALSADGKTLAVTDWGGVVRGYDVPSGKRVGKGVSPDTWLGVAWLGEHTAACWSRRGRLAVWDTRIGKTERELIVAKPADTTGGVDELAVSPDGKRVAVREWKHTKGSVLRVFDLATGKVTWELPDGRSVPDFAFHPDGDKLVVKDNDELHTYDLTGKTDPRTVRLKGSGGRFNDDGRTLFQFGCGNFNCYLTRTEVSGGKERWTWRKGSDGVNDWRGGIVGLHPADDVVWVANGDTVHGIDRLTGNTRWAVERLPVANKPRWRAESRALFAASRDDRWLAVGLKFNDRGDRDGEAFGVYDLQTKAGRDRPLLSPPLQRPIAGLAVSPGGRQVIVLTSTGEQEVWDLEKLRRVTPDPFDEVWEHLGLEGIWVVEAMTTLTADPERAVKLLAETLPPVAEPDAEQVKRWLGELGSPDFKTRDHAERELNEVLDTARVLILAAAEKPANAEAGERLERLVQRINHFLLWSESWQVIRAVEVVERLRTPAAVKLLERWAGGAAGALLTTEAKASLKRVKR